MDDGSSYFEASRFGPRKVSDQEARRLAREANEALLQLIDLEGMIGG